MSDTVPSASSRASKASSFVIIPSSHSTSDFWYTPFSNTHDPETLIKAALPEEANFKAVYSVV